VLNVDHPAKHECLDEHPNEWPSDTQMNAQMNNPNEQRQRASLPTTGSRTKHELQH
jgi:hypothetical protein